jgi:hypothetical protein
MRVYIGVRTRLGILKDENMIQNLKSNSMQHTIVVPVQLRPSSLEMSPGSQKERGQIAPNLRFIRNFCKGTPGCCSFYRSISIIFLQFRHFSFQLSKKC